MVRSTSTDLNHRPHPPAQIGHFHGGARASGIHSVGFHDRHPWTRLPQLRSSYLKYQKTLKCCWRTVSADTDERRTSYLDEINTRVLLRTVIRKKHKLHGHLGRHLPIYANQMRSTDANIPRYVGCPKWMSVLLSRRKTTFKDAVSRIEFFILFGLWKDGF